MPRTHRVSFPLQLVHRGVPKKECQEYVDGSAALFVAFGRDAQPSIKPAERENPLHLIVTKSWFDPRTGRLLLRLRMRFGAVGPSHRANASNHAENAGKQGCLTPAHNKQ